MARLFSCKNRPAHCGPYPLERLKRQQTLPDLNLAPAMQPLVFGADVEDRSIIPAMAPFMAILDAIRDGDAAASRAEIPDCAEERARHVKAAGYYFDANQAGITRTGDDSWLETPFRNPGLDKLALELQDFQPKTFASGIDVVIADVRESAIMQPQSVRHHRFAAVFLVEHPREPDVSEPGGDWIAGTCEHRSALRAAETAVIMANYLRIMGFEARAHTATSSDVDLGKLAVRAGLLRVESRNGNTVLVNPYVGRRYALAAITTELEMAPDSPLAEPGVMDHLKSHGPRWWLGMGTTKNAFNATPYMRRHFKDGALPFEKLRRVDKPTTLIDRERVARVPKRADMFARALFGDMGKTMQNAAKGGFYVLKNPLGYCARRVIAALILKQDGEAAPNIDETAHDPAANADRIKAALYFLGADAVGLSECPDWAYYSHDAGGNELKPYHREAMSILVDQGQETMEGCSGDDWISAAQSMRAYLRTSLIGGVIAEQIRRLGYTARVHSVLDGEVLQPPLLLLSGLGEVSRIGEVILNPYLGPRLKSGAVTTNLPMAHDRPIDFGMQSFCQACNKCARECPSGAITAGPKVMFNGYEIWKSDSERCTRYRLTNLAGSMCGRCMKTCPWNLEGLFQEAPFRWLAMNAPWAAPFLAKLDDLVGNGELNPVKKWWWDIELEPEGRQRYIKARQTNARALQKDLKLKAEDQTLAVYPAHLVPPPYPAPFPMDREKGIEAFQNLLSPDAYRQRLEAGETRGLVPQRVVPDGDPPVFPVIIAESRPMTDRITAYELRLETGELLPAFTAGAHISVCVAPEYFRDYSLVGDPEDRSRYLIGVLREDAGEGGSKLMHRIFANGRKVFIAPPKNHFPLDELATRSVLIAGGIGVTPLISMGHRLHRLGREFELHYCARNRGDAGFLDDLASCAWANRVAFHFSAEGERANLTEILGNHASGSHVYSCGPARLMAAVAEAAERLGWPEDAVHSEYFAVPDQEERANYPFILKLARTGRSFQIPADRSATDVLAEHGIHVDVKCSEGICGVCKTALIDGEADHRDFVLARKERSRSIMLCCSRAAGDGGTLRVDL